MYHPIALGILGLVVSALVNLVVPIIIGMMSTSFEKQYGRELPLWLFIVCLTIAIIIIYRLLGMPVAKAVFRHPLSRRAIILQAVVGALILPLLTLYAEVGVIYLAQFVTVLTAVPIVGQIVATVIALPQSWAMVIIVYTTCLTTGLGVWCSLALSWVEQKIRS